MNDDELWLYHTRTALSHLYDPVQLETHPLGELLSLRAEQGRPVGEALRRMLREAVESLRPTTPFAPGQSEWVGYRILQMRYLHGEGVESICGELALSEATFYRRHRQALEAVSHVLRARAQREEVSSSSTPVEPDQADNGRDEAVKLARQAPREMIDLRAIVDDAALTFIPLAAAREIALHLDVPAELPPACVDPAMIHQIVLNVLMAGLRLAAGKELWLSVNPQRDETVWRLAGLRDDPTPDTELQGSSELTLSESLLDVYGGRLWVEVLKGRGTVLCFALPCAFPRTILLIDDDADTVMLYRRFLQSEQYRVRTASSGAELGAALAKELPDLVLLDVLMPREDGWKLLQRLKTTPETRAIPVVICSVLSQPSLALALGAARVLHKPISRKTLLETVEQVLRERGTSAV